MAEKNGCLFVVFALIKKAMGKNQKEKLYPYQSKKWIMTKAEISFYHCLQSCLSAEEHCIFTKVRLEDIIGVKKGTENYNQFRNRIKSRHIDFVICQATTGEIQFTIELNDNSHNAPQRQQRDKFIKEALNAANIKNYEVTCQRTYNVDHIRKLLEL